LEKYSALLLLMSVFFVGNNIAHEFDHALSSPTSAQVECDSCHISKGTLLSQSSLLPTALYTADQSSLKPVSKGSRSRFSSYISRAPPRT
jgi:hypothetical protein